MRPYLIAVALVLLPACDPQAGARPSSGQRALDAPSATTTTTTTPTTTTAPPPSDAPECGHPDEVIGVCSISAEGVTVQARGLTPGATAAFGLDGDGSAPPRGCGPRWRREVLVDARGVATARFDLPAGDPCRLLASMTVRLDVHPGGVERGPVRFGTLPPP